MCYSGPSPPLHTRRHIRKREEKVTPTLRKDIEALIQRERSNIRSDYTEAEVQLYARSLVVALTGTWHFSALHMDIHLYRDVLWDQQAVERYRQALEEVFGVEVPWMQFLCARTMADVCHQVMRVLRREGRTRAHSPPAA